MLANTEWRAARYERIILENERRTLILKLRWMGLEQEADRYTAPGDTTAAISVPEETD